MAVRFFYVDESYDSDKYCLSALSIRHSDWKKAFDMVRAHRANLKNDHGVFLRAEIHARDLVAGRAGSRQQRSINGNAREYFMAC